MRRPENPFPIEFFGDSRAPLGAVDFSFSFGGIHLTLEGIDQALRRQLNVRYGPYAREFDDDRPILRIAVLVDEDHEYFIEPRPGELNPILLDCDGTRVRTLGYCSAGWFDTDTARGQLVLSRGSIEPPERSVENYVRPAVAWQAASRGGALVHAASAVYKDRAYLFYGESGAGKSTLSASNRRARVVSDDLSLLLPGASGGLELVGTPFRGTYEEGEPFLGQAPLAAGFRIIKDARADVKSVSRLRALSELIGNLPFVAEAFEIRPDLFEGVDRAFRDVPLAHLHFRKDDSYWDAIDRAGL